jgi:hypothetical protein
MIRATRISLFALALCIGSGMLAATANARTIPAAAGSPASLSGTGQSIDDFAWLSTGIAAPNASAGSPRIWIIPVVIDTSGLKGFIVKGTPNPSLSCFVDQRGTVNQSVAVPVSAVGTNPAAVFLNVVAGNTVVVRCTFTSSSGRVLLVDHNQ